jgi:hypothetical protein
MEMIMLRTHQSTRYSVPVMWALLLMSSMGLAMSAAPIRAELVNVLTIPGETTDLWPGTGANDNRLGFGSDLYYDASNDVYYGLADRGPTGGTASYLTRVQQFKLHVDPATGAISNFDLQRTIPFKTADGGASYNALQPSDLNGDTHTLGLSLDSEGFVVGPNGSFYVADEYGPALYEFAPVDVSGQIEARFVRSFAIPDNLVPRNVNGEVDYFASRTTDPAQATGRQTSRGFEGVTITPDGSTLFAIMQDPLHEEGDQNDGRRGRQLRIVSFNVATGESTGQFAYSLDDIGELNRLVPPAAAFGATQQGRNVGVSSITAIDQDRFLVLERDNRGLDVENATLSDPILSSVGIKRLYQIDLSGATDISQISLAGSNSLPAGVVPAKKRLLIDAEAALENAGLVVPAKMEGVALGPRLNDGSYSLVISTDNDFSALQIIDPNMPTEVVSVYSDGSTGPLDGDAMGRSLLPINLLAFRTPTLIAPTGDFDQSGLVDVSDIDRLSLEIAAGQHPAAFDLTTDARVDGSDLRYFVKYLAETSIGDANLDGQFNSSDLIQVSQAGGYEQDTSAVWSQGDWQADGRFNSADLVAAFQDGGYTVGPAPAAPVAEPSSTVAMAAAGLACVLLGRARRK